MSDYEVHRDLALEDPAYMATETYAIHNIRMVKSYAKMRVFGAPPSVAFRKVWGHEFWDGLAQQRIYAIESTNQYNKEFREILYTTPKKEFWNEREAIHRLLVLVNDVFETASSRMRAVQELNVIFGITIVDDEGQTRRGSQMSDFYNDIGTEKKRTASTITMGKTH